MPTLLLIETATRVCSVALSRNGVLLAMEETIQPNAHSAFLSVFIDRLFHSTHLSVQDLDGIAVSQGPGSYTGLRIGVSSAKGIAYASGCPILAVDTLQTLAAGARDKYPHENYLALLDAKRMEVYAGLYDENLEPLRAVQADIVSENYYDEIISKTTPTVVIGDGAAKCRPFLTSPLMKIDTEIQSSAKYMIAPAEQKYDQKQFEDTAYFEPFYLKDFIAGKPKVKGLFE